MKKCVVFLLAFLFLTSCASKEFEQDIAQQYRSASHISIEAEIAAEFSDRTDKYKVLYDYEKGSNATVTLLEPETIAGIKATIEEGSATFKFEETVLEMGMDLDAPTPMNVLHKLVRIWSFSKPSQKGKADAGVLLVFDEGDYQYRTVFSNDNLPLYTEVMFNSKLKMKIDFIKCEGLTNAN